MNPPSDSNTPGANPAALAGGKPAPNRWYALAILFLASIMNTIDKQLVPALAEPLRLEFGLSDTELGFLAGLVFAVAYSVAAIPMGVLIDRVNRTRLLAGLLVGWSLLSTSTISRRSMTLTAIPRRIGC